LFKAVEASWALMMQLCVLQSLLLKNFYVEEIGFQAIDKEAEAPPILLPLEPL
jgi:hypothetical protein